MVGGVVTKISKKLPWQQTFNVFNKTINHKFEKRTAQLLDRDSITTRL